MNTVSDKSTAELEREIGQDRQRIEEKLNAIQERLTPGQMIDEVLGYMKAKGATEYFANLGQTAKNNPLPLALMGVSLAWLMASPTRLNNDMSAARQDRKQYPLANVTGSVRRTRPVYSEGESFYSEFVDDSGKQFRALTDEAGRRSGDFVDEAGQIFSGFADATGRRINDIRDETGALFDSATGWASDTWQSAKEQLKGMADSISNAGDRMRSSTSSAMGILGQQTGDLSDAIMHRFRDQPLVGGALAFAAGAALGAALPHTQQEDNMLGEMSDDIRQKATAQASDLIDKGEDVAKDVYDKALSVASDVHDAAKDRIQEETQKSGGFVQGKDNGRLTAH